MDISIREQALIACRKLLSHINRDPATNTYGCFDRRFWAWKLTDFPEATFQRNATALTWYMRQDEVKGSKALQEAVRSAILFALRIQHKDGSFDQAYPNEHSYGATAFLLPDLCSAFEAIEPQLDAQEASRIRSRLRQSADFLCDSSEQHSLISNHLAGAALGLHKAGKIFNETRYMDKSRSIVLEDIIAHQSDEGWYVEYGGADPGYQALCMYYLAQVFQDDPSEELKTSLKQSLDFLQYFIHPDGTFGGEYGSRRTEIFYPGGIALLAKTFPTAAAISVNMARSIETGRTTTLMDIDFGNNAPLLNNYILASEVVLPKKPDHALPFEKKSEYHAFKDAGIGIKGNAEYYTIFGASNGGVCKIFKKQSSRMIYDDCGILGETARKQIITCQVTNLENTFTAEEDKFSSSATFSGVNAQTPTPFNYLLLRLSNLTFMRSRRLNEWIKKIMVKLLISGKNKIPLSRERRIRFQDELITIEDTIAKNGNIQLKWLKQGIKFSAIHMASSRYFSPSQMREQNTQEIDFEPLNRSGSVQFKTIIDVRKGTINQIDG